MDDLNATINIALAKMMREKYGVDVDAVLSWEDDTESDGYCDSCYYEYAVVRVKYLDSAGTKQKWTYSGSFSELINSL